ncbi:MAG: hypothetical protein RR230_02755 [Oscillospiraceae bacterium]
MFRALIYSQLQSLFASMFRGSKNKKKHGIGSKILIGLLALYLLGCFAVMFGGLFHSICKPFVGGGFGWLYFAMAGIMAFALCFIGSVFTAQQQLFSAKDNDILLAMPIPPAYILGSRMLMLLILNYLFEIMVMAPAGVVYCVNYAPSLRGVLVFIVCLLLLPLLVMTFSCLFGWLLAIVTDRVRNKSMVTTLCSLIFLGAYFYAFSNMNKYLAGLVQNGAQIAEAVKSALYPAWAFGAAVAEGNLAALLGWICCCILPMTLVYIILSRSFISVTTTRRGAAKLKYRERELKVGSGSSALLGRELRHFASNGMYIMNAALGSVFTLAAAVFLVIYREKVMTMGTMLLGENLAAGGAAMLCLMASTNLISAPSVSLEGKSLWVIQSLPVSGGSVLMAKVKSHIVIAAPPVLITAIAAIFILRPAPLGVAALLLAPIAMTAFCAFLGVVVNMHFPRFDYINETAAVKQSMSVIISMFVSMGAVLLPGAVYIWLLAGVMSADVFLLICSAVFALCCFVMYRWLTGPGSRRFAEL